MKVKVLVTQSCPTLCDSSTDCSPTSLLRSWDSPGKNTGVGSHSLLQVIFPTQGSKLSLLHYRQIHYHLSHQGSPTIYWLNTNLSHTVNGCSEIWLMRFWLSQKAEFLTFSQSVTSKSECWKLVVPFRVMAVFMETLLCDEDFLNWMGRRLEDH